MTRPALIVIAISLTAVLLACVVFFVSYHPGRPYRTETKQQIASNAVTSNAHRPQAIAKDGLTFMTYLSMQNTSLYVSCYDYETNNSTQPYLVAFVAWYPDMHWSPAITILNNRIVIFVFSSLTLQISNYTIPEIKENKSRLAHWHSDVAYPYKPTIGAINYYQVYPYNNEKEIAVIYSIQGGENGDGAAWWRTSYNGTVWQQPIKIFSNMPDRLYMFTTQIGEELLLTGYETFRSEYGRGKNVYFAWSSDHGITWKKADGTQLALPMNTSAKILNSTVSTMSCSAILDENDKPLITVIYRNTTGKRPDPTAGLEWEYLTGDYNVKIAYYNAQLGSQGEWKYDFARDEQGNLLTTTIYRRN